MFSCFFNCASKKKDSATSNLNLCLSLIDMDTNEYPSMLEKLTANWSNEEFTDTISQLENHSASVGVKAKIYNILKILRAENKKSNTLSITR